MNRILFGAVVFSIAFTVACKSDFTNEEEVTKLVKIEKLSKESEINYLIFNGKVKEKSLTMLSFRVGGPLVAVNVNQGDYVKKGDVIAQIDKRDYQIQLSNAKAQYEQIKGEYARYKELYANNKIPANTYEKIESGYKMAKAGYENALNQLNDTELKAPVSGYIHDKMVENFTTVGPGHPVVSIIDLSQLETVVGVPENQIIKIKNSNKSYLSVKNANVSDILVKLKSINEKAGKDGMYEVRFILDNQENLNILPGMTAEVKVKCTQGDESLSIPSDVVFMKNNMTHVWIYNPVKGVVVCQEVVVTSFQPNGMLQVEEGLKSGDLIVTAGVHSLSEGQKVKPIGMGSATNVGGLL